MTTDVVPTVVHVTPSTDSHAVSVSPVRRNRTQYGAVTTLPAVLVLSPPAATRRWNLFPLPGVTIMIPCGASGERLSRIITPALTQAWTASTVATRATISPSPVRG